MNKVKEFIIDTFDSIRRNCHSFKANIVCGFRNLYIWFPVIWRDRGWDHYFLLAMMEKKLTEMSKTFKSELEWCDNEQIIKEIDDIVVHLNRLKNDNYLHEEHEKLHEEFGEHEFKEIPGGMYQMVRWDDEKEEAYSKRIKELFEQEQKMKQEDLDFVFDNMKKQILGWWS